MPRLSTGSRQAKCNALVDLIDAGTGAGKIQIYTAPRPATANDTATGTLLGTLTFSDPAFGSASTAGVATANSVTQDSSADATGIAAWARVSDSDDTVVMDVSVGTSGAELNLDSVNIVAGGTIAVQSFTYTQPEGT